MIDLKPCRGCGRPLIHHSVANLAVRLEPTPLDLNGIMGELAASRSLWMVDGGKVRPARPGEAGPLREHRCSVKAADAPLEPSQPSPPPGVPANPPVRPRTPSRRSSGQRTTPPGVLYAGSRVSDIGEGPVCDSCSTPMADGTYASIEVGELTVWAQHVSAGDCTGRMDG